MSVDPIVENRIKERLSKVSVEQKGRSANIFIQSVDPAGNGVRINFTVAIRFLPERDLFNMQNQIAEEIVRRSG